MSAKFNTARLSSGDAVPNIGFGTWELKASDIPRLINGAIASGFRHLDCAAIYQNETEIGQALVEILGKRLVTRDQLFVTSKLWCTMMAPELVERALDRTLASLQLDYLNLYLIHWPLCFEGDEQMKSIHDADGTIKLRQDGSIAEVWKAMCKMVEKGKAKAVGVSNFTISKLEALISATGFVPAVNQVELHPYLPQTELVEYCKAKGILVEAYSPLGSGKEPKLLEDDVVQGVAKDESLTPAQVLISWALMRGTIPLVRTSKIERIAANLEVKPLSKESMGALDSITKRHRYVDALHWAGHQVFDDAAQPERQP